MKDGVAEFFLILDRLLQEPREKHHDLLELMYVCLALDSKARCAYVMVAEQSWIGFRRIYSTLYATCVAISRPALSPHWLGARDLRTPLARFVPLWVVGALALGMLAVTYFAFLLLLNKKSDPVAVRAAALGQSS